MAILTATLLDGSVVSIEDLNRTVAQLKTIREFYGNPVALYDIYQKCRNVNYQFQTGDSRSPANSLFFLSRTQLRDVGLIDEKDNPVSEEVKKIVLNYLWINVTEKGTVPVLRMPEGGYRASSLLDNGCQVSPR